MDKRLELQHSLYVIYGTAKTSETEWFDLSVTNQYSSKFEAGSWEEFKEEFWKSKPALTRYWIYEKIKSKTSPPSLLTCYKEFIVNETISYPNVSQLLQICIAVPPPPPQNKLLGTILLQVGHGM